MPFRPLLGRDSAECRCPEATWSAFQSSVAHPAQLPSFQAPHPRRGARALVPPHGVGLAPQAVVWRGPLALLLSCHCAAVVLPCASLRFARAVVAAGDREGALPPFCTGSPRLLPREGTFSSSESEMSAQRALALACSATATGSTGATCAGAGRVELLAGSISSSTSSSDSAKSAHRIGWVSRGSSETDAVVEASDSSSSASTAAQVDRCERLPRELPEAWAVSSASTAWVHTPSCAAGVTGLGARTLRKQVELTLTACDEAAPTERLSMGRWCAGGAPSVSQGVSNVVLLMPRVCLTEAPAFLWPAPAIC
mmetsp:Transcript_44676/g.129230  ORF Transcript_44676/g.129230 Transcript_44676/m.129230 type:complete len:311 (+) Transcript_44676:64-996(+)